MLAVFAAKEAQQIGENVAATRSQLVNSGYHYGRVPFGYRKRAATSEEIASGAARRMATPNTIPHVFEPDPVTRHIALECFERVAAGASLRSVARWMASLPEEQRGGRWWPTECVAGLLRSPTYVGRPSEGQENVLARPRARWEAIVPDETWTAVDEQLGRHVESGPQRPSGRYLLTGFLRCPHCGEKMNAGNHKRMRGSEKVRADYRCSGSARGANATIPNCQYGLPMATVDVLVLDQVGRLVTALESVDDGVLEQGVAASAPPVTDWAKQIAACERGIAESQQLLADATALLVKGTLDMIGYGALRDSEVAAITASEAEIRRLQQKQCQPARQPRLVDSARALRALASHGAEALRHVDVSIQRRILGHVVERVVVTRTGYRAYAADITWTALGRQIDGMLGETRAA